MSKEIVITVISGIVGLVGGIIACIQAIRTSRLKADADSTLERIRSETSISLENMKLDQERRKRAFEVAIEESRPIEASLAQAWHDIQSIKDVISKYMSGFRFDENSARQSFASAYASLCEGYAKWGTEVPDSARHGWHKAKGCAMSVEILLLKEDSRGDMSLLPEGTTDSLKEIRIVLTDSQLAIAATRNAIRDTMMKRVLELV